MRITDYYQMVLSLDDKEREHWATAFQNTLTKSCDELTPHTLGRFIVAVHRIIEDKRDGSERFAIAYGAGNMAKDFLPQIKKGVHVSELWDAYSNLGSLYGVPIIKPHFDTVSADADVIIFIENSDVRYTIESQFRAAGCTRVYSYSDYADIVEAVNYFRNIVETTTEETIRLFTDFIGGFTTIENDNPPVCYTVIPKKLETINIDVISTREKAHAYYESLVTHLKIADADAEIVKQLVCEFLESDIQNAFVFAYKLEVFLRCTLSGGVKTRYRPIRMHGDRPYDQFAVFAVLDEMFNRVFADARKALSAIELLRLLSSNTVPLISLECHLLAKCGRFEDALHLSRKAVNLEPNGLLASETFVNIAYKCKERRIAVTEPLPDYDLNTRFCWSGLNYALCFGFNNKDKTAEMIPCFRVFQCAALPTGEFWSGEEWVEFRKSLLDGTFRYCQKDQCSNIVAGWLPRKARSYDDEIQRVINGDFSTPPPLEELHFSYDSHCNMKCPSCRLEIRTNSAERNAELDFLFEKNLRPLLKNAKHLCLSGCGEAIISPHSKRVLQSLSRAEYPELAVELRTNAFCFTQAAWDALGTGREVIRHVAASIDSSSKELFEKIRCPAKWETVLKNLAFIQSLRNTNQIDMFEFHVVIQTENIDELVDIIKMAVSFDVDAVTFSRLINWRNMTQNEYFRVNPYIVDSPHHERLMQVSKEIVDLRASIERGECELTAGREKKLYINMHFVPDPNPSYDVIRYGDLKIR